MNRFSALLFKSYEQHTTEYWDSCPRSEFTRRMRLLDIINAERTLLEARLR